MSARIPDLDDIGAGAGPDTMGDMTIEVTDPVCGVVLDLADAEVQMEYDGWAYFFCSQECRRRFAAHSQRHALSASGRAGPAGSSSSAGRVRS
ncbi:YHS domain-containing protein [Afifella pfennigii]|uniref:YHS domain-containing protein n=1 Tax=Afifella pfennigii TaxID=209897 RepID=UPI00054EFDCA|nr:YHS domain-containing protein [Afifella pfennigii]